MLVGLVYCLGLLATAQKALMLSLAHFKVSGLFGYLAVVPGAVFVFLLTALAFAVMSAVAVGIGDRLAERVSVAGRNCLGLLASAERTRVLDLSFLEVSCLFYDLTVIPDAVTLFVAVAFTASTLAVVSVLGLLKRLPLAEYVRVGLVYCLGLLATAERAGVLDLTHFKVSCLLYSLSAVPYAVVVFLLTAFALAVMLILSSVKRLPLTKSVSCRLVYCLGLFCTAESAGISHLAFLKMSRLFRLLSVIPITVAIFLLAALALAVVSAVALGIGNIVAVYVIVIIYNAKGRYLGRKLAVKYLRNVGVDLTL